MSNDDPKSPPGEPKQSGRVAYDSKGNPVWEWKTSTGVYDRNVSTQRLKMLEAELSLEETPPAEKSAGLSLQEAACLPGGGINPYNSGGPAINQPTAPAVHPVLAHKQSQAKTSRKSLVSKYKKTPEPPQGLWNKLKARIKGDT